MANAGRGQTMPPGRLGHRCVQAALSAATHTAEREGAHIVVAIVDASGLLLGLSRMPQAFLASGDYAEWKAWTAVSFRMSTHEFDALLASLPEEIRRDLLRHPKATSLPGGVLIETGGAIVGGVGVSGSTGEIDSACAAAAREACVNLLG